jgi:Domain of unknown function (DUF3472)
MNKGHLYFVMAMALMFGVQGQATAATEALDWHIGKENNATCLYGQITILTTIQGIYFCGAQFNQGYSGIQDLNHNLHTALFSIWDTARDLRATITQVASIARPGRFGGEGTGSHVNFDNSWKIGQIYQFFLQKNPGKQPNTTDTSFCVFDIPMDQWLHIATVTTPNGPKRAGTTFGGVLSWIENIGGNAPAATPKIALYDLWLGPNVNQMQRLTRSGGASGSGCWGQLNGEYFLAEGSAQNLQTEFDQLKSRYGEPLIGKDGKQLPPLPDKPLPAKLIEELENVAQ